MTFNPGFQYDIHIDEQAPLALQPDAITIPMKPHQRASLHKAMVMETYGRVSYNAPHPERFMTGRYNVNSHDVHFRNTFEVETNIGILGDAIGSGKTVLALSLVAAIPVSNIHRRTQTVHSYQGRTGAYLRSTMQYNDNVVETEEQPPPSRLRTTLIVVPRGPVFTQFVNAIRDQTTLNVLCVDSITVIKRIMPKPNVTNAELREFIERFDAVLVKNTSIKTLQEYYGNRQDSPLQGWDRVIVDEACDILNHTPLFSFSFMWMISATYVHLIGMSSSYRNQMAYAIRDVVVSQETINHLLVKCTDQFVTKSFNVPPPIESFYLCDLPRTLAAVHSFLSPSVRERIDANDLMGALTLLGATEETENDVVTLVTKEIEREIRNREREIEYIRVLDITDDVRAARLVTPTADLARLQEKLKNLVERVTALEEKSCTICMDSLENPLLLPCSHIFCARCLISWMQFNHNTCPTCRTGIQSRQLVSIVKAKETTEQSGASASGSAGASSSTHQFQQQRIHTYSKEDTLVNIIQANPSGKFVVFSKLDSSYWGCTNRLRNGGISFNLLRGNSNVMGCVLDRFREGYTRVLLLNTVHAASGIDISSATDLVILHDLGLGRTQAVGRCNRHPRTVPLRIHQLCYPHEISADVSAVAAPAPAQVDVAPVAEDSVA